MNMSKSRDIQAKMPSPKVIYASNESKSVLARNLEECRDNDKNSQSVFLSFKCILARNCESTEQLQSYKNWQPAVKNATWYAKKRKDEKENDKKYDIRQTGKANPFICASADCG